MATDYVINDGYRQLTFTGVLLARASSWVPGKYRWLELTLYRTLGGQYVVERVGASRVAHVADCDSVIDNLPRFQEIYPGRSPDESEFHCCSCMDNGYDFPSLLVERNLRWAQITEDPAVVINMLTRPTKANPRWLSLTAAALLVRASDVDEGIRRVYAGVQVHVE